MTQADLFDYPHARTEDVDTSHEAVPVNLTEQAFTILRSYAGGYPLLDEDAYKRQGLTGHQRCSDLRKEGLIERCGRGRTDMGKAGYLCRITDKGRQYLIARGG